MRLNLHDEWANVKGFYLLLFLIALRTISLSLLNLLEKCLNDNDKFNLKVQLPS